MFGAPSCVHRPTLHAVDAHAFHAPLAVTHVPEIGLPSLELGTGPRKHHTVLMAMIAWVVVGDDAAGWCADGMNVSAALIRRLNVTRRQTACAADVGQHRLA